MKQRPGNNFGKWYKIAVRRRSWACNDGVITTSTSSIRRAQLVNEEIVYHDIQAREQFSSAYETCPQLRFINYMFFDGKLSIGVPPQESAFSENTVRDLDLWTHDLEDVISVMWIW